MSITTAYILFILVMDPFGNIPFFLSILKSVQEKRRRIVIVRELLIALSVMIFFLFVGPPFLRILQISDPSLRMAGGIVLFLIAVKMIFGETEEIFRNTPGGEPMIVPLAIPAIAGPSAVATILLLVGQYPDRWPEWLFALVMAWLSTSIILIVSTKLDRLLGERGLTAIGHLMGLILTVISVEMFVQGVKKAFF